MNKPTQRFIENFSFLAPKAFLYRVVINILNNAYQQIEIKQEGNIAIHAEVVGEFGHLYIRDTAGGVTQEIIDGLFNNYKTTKKDGTGIGLGFCKYIMEQLGGDLKAQLIENEFIDFVLIFPVKN
ncbi:MAG: ATP-binding protein [Gammaproteobacteria bacterium]